MNNRFLKILNTFLLILIIITAIYIVAAPFLPQIIRANTSPPIQSSIQSTQKTTPPSSTIDPTSLLKLSPDKDSEEKFTSPVDTNVFRINIPSIKLDSKLISSNTNNDLWKGIWHRSNTGNPIDGGNMVITAHRFLYTGNTDTFYHLPEIQLNEIISITWKGIQYDYKVTKLFEVKPNAIEIEAPTKDHILTLYTCTPLWTSARRFVVQAQPLF